MAAVVIEIIYEGDHCIPCVYMLEAVEEAMAAFGQTVSLEVVHLREKKGGLRYNRLSRHLGRPAPIPSIFINGQLCFNVTPPVQELQHFIRRILSGG